MASQNSAVSHTSTHILSIQRCTHSRLIYITWTWWYLALISFIWLTLVLGSQSGNRSLAGKGLPGTHGMHSSPQSWLLSSRSIPFIFYSEITDIRKKAYLNGGKGRAARWGKSWKVGVGLRKHERFSEMFDTFIQVYFPFRVTLHPTNEADRQNHPQTRLLLKEHMISYTAGDSNKNI